MKRSFFLAAMLVLAAITRGNAQLSFSTRIVADSVFIPWEILWAPDNHIWFTQKNGYICRVEPVTKTIDTIYHQTNTAIYGEGGMLGMTIVPTLISTYNIYVAYEFYGAGGNYRERIMRYTYDLLSQSVTDTAIILDGIEGAIYHNGCRLLVAGDKLFITTGDATQYTTHPQDVMSVNGKVLRVNPDGSIPADNPFPNSPVWSWGHRNPQGLCYANGKLYSSEHGPNNDDEVNIIQKGRNYGWPTVQGFCDAADEMSFCADSNVVEPLIAWTPTLAVCGIEYYGAAMFPSLQNCLLMCTLKDNNLYRLALNAAGDSVTGATAIPSLAFGRLRDICVSPDGKIYLSTSNSNAAGTDVLKDQIIELYDPSATSVKDAAYYRAVRCFPIPARNELNVVAEGFGSAMLHYRIVDMQGKAAQEGSVANKGKLAMAGLQAGGYFLEVWQDGQPELAAQLFQKAE